MTRTRSFRSLSSSAWWSTRSSSSSMRASFSSSFAASRSAFALFLHPNLAQNRPRHAELSFLLQSLHGSPDGASDEHRELAPRAATGRRRRRRTGQIELKDVAVFALRLRTNSRWTGVRTGVRTVSGQLSGQCPVRYVFLADSVRTLSGQSGHCPDSGGRLDRIGEAPHKVVRCGGLTAAQLTIVSWCNTGGRNGRVPPAQQKNTLCNTRV